MPFVYVLSYAPVVRVNGREYIQAGRVDFWVPSDGIRFPLYKPVDWLIDNTPLRGPLFIWAGLWGVGGEFREATDWRKGRRDIGCGSWDAAGPEGPSNTR